MCTRCTINVGDEPTPTVSISFKLSWLPGLPTYPLLVSLLWPAGRRPAASVPASVSRAACLPAPSRQSFIKRKRNLRERHPARAPRTQFGFLHEVGSKRVSYTRWAAYSRPICVIACRNPCCFPAICANATPGPTYTIRIPTRGKQQKGPRHSVLRIRWWSLARGGARRSARSGRRGAARSAAAPPRSMTRARSPAISLRRCPATSRSFLPHRRRGRLGHR